MRVWVISSGSSGNAALIESCGERILVDAGVGPTRAVEALRCLGVDLFPKGALGVIATHEHEDHVAKLEPLVRALRAPALLHDEIVAQRVRNRFPVIGFAPGGSFEIGPFKIKTRVVPHDACQIALRIEAEGRALGWVTDIGHVPASFPFFFEGCQTVFLESNYDAELLAFGPYPPKLRARVEGPFGHLDNADAARLASAIEKLGVEQIKLSHLSAVNNTPERALAAVTARVKKAKVEVIPNGVPMTFDVAKPVRPGVQLSLF